MKENVATSGISLHQVNLSSSYDSRLPSMMSQYLDVYNQTQTEMNKIRSDNYGQNRRAAVLQYQVGCMSYFCHCVHLQVGALFTKGRLLNKPVELPIMVGMYSSNSYHTPAIVINELSNVYARQFPGEEFNIETANEPLPERKVSVFNAEEGVIFRQVSPVSFSQAINDLQVWVNCYIVTFNLTFGLAIVVAWFPIVVARERITKMKHLQVVFCTFLLYFLSCLASRWCQPYRHVAWPFHCRRSTLYCRRYDTLCYIRRL